MVAGGDDRGEGLALRPQAVVLGPQVPGHVALAAAHEAARHDQAERLVGHRAGAPHRGDLALVLDDAQERDRWPDVAQATPVQAAQAPVRGVAQLRALKARAARAAPSVRAGLVHAVRQQRLLGHC